MKKEELRIGNYVLDQKGEVRRITGVVSGSQVGVVYFEHNDNCHAGAHMINPIPLTPELLEKCGFARQEEFGTEGFGMVTYELNKGNVLAPHGNNRYAFGGTLLKDKGEVLVSFTVNNLWGSRNVRYLHQLQNLHYAIFGEELEIHLSKY